MKNVDVLIHFNDAMDTKEKEGLLDQLSNTNGVVNQNFSEHREHLLFVEYDANITSSLDLLNQVKAQGFESQLVGI